MPVFAVSIAAFLLSLLYTYVLTNGAEIMGRAMAITSAIITALLLFFIWYSWLMTPAGACSGSRRLDDTRPGHQAIKQGAQSLSPPRPPSPLSHLVSSASSADSAVRLLDTPL